jgi:hypothetical protein
MIKLLPFFVTAFAFAQTPTPSPTPTPTPTPAPLTIVNSTVRWNATIGDTYTIIYGLTSAATSMQVDGGTAQRTGPMSVAIGNLKPNTLYFFSDIVYTSLDCSAAPNDCGRESLPLPPVKYRTGSVVGH